MNGGSVCSGSMKQSQQLTHLLFLHGDRMKLQVRKSKFTHTHSGVLGQIMDTMEVGEQPAGMSDATKRRKEDPEEFSSESEWDATVGH